MRSAAQHPHPQHHVPPPPPPSSHSSLHEASTSSLGNTVNSVAAPAFGAHESGNEASPLLLRPWREASPHASPPVAPAVVVATDDGDDTNLPPHASLEQSSMSSVPSASRFMPTTPYSYPVATFVRDLVRSSMDHVHVQATGAFRSEPNVMLGSHHHQGADATETEALTVRTLDDLDATNVDEFIIVDGDLVAMPPPPPNVAEQQGYEDQLRDQVKSCQPNRLRRHVRKFNRFFFKRGQAGSVSSGGSNGSGGGGRPLQTRVQQQQQHLQRPDVGVERRTSEGSISTNAASSTNTSQGRRGLHMTGLSTRSVDHSLSSAAALSPPSASTPSGRSGTAANRRKMKRRGRAWRRGDGTASDDAGTDSAPATSQLTPEGGDHLASVGAGQIPPRHEFMEADEQRLQSVTASFVGTADQLLVAGVLPAGIAAEAYIEYDDDVKSKLYADDVVPSLVSSSASSYTDYKVDKSDGPDFETMLQRAALETRYDLDHSSNDVPCFFKRGKSESGSPSSVVPLSMSTERDVNVHNDMLKVVMVGNLLEKSWLARALRENYKRPPKRTTLALDVRTWNPPLPPALSSSVENVSSEQLPVKFQIWDTQGATSTIDGSPNFGGHPATQSLFFSPQSLYMLVWDLAGNNCKTFHRKASSFGRKAGSAISPPLEDNSDSEDEDDEEDYGNEFAREEANRQADRALHADIRNHVLSWVDCIVKRAPKSAILPVAIVPEGMDEREVARRCSIMQSLLEQHVQRWVASLNAPKLLCGAEDVLRVSYGGYGLHELRETLVAIATDASKSVFDHVGSPVPFGTAIVLDTCRRLKADHSLLLVDHLMFEIGSVLSLDQVLESLHFLASTGEILYFGTPNDDILSRYIVLSRKWLVSAISCILRNDLKRELAETRRFMNMQCLYSNQRYEENEIAHALAGATTSSCPLLSDMDAQMLWQSMSFMREAADRSADLGESPTDTPTLFAFLERLLVASGVLVPVARSRLSLDRSEVFFVPSLLAQVDPREIWTYRTSESWMTTLCHSWLFRDGAPTNLMEGITVGVLRDLYDFSRSFQGTLEKKPPSHVRTVPMGAHSFHEFYEDHGEQPIGRFRIHQVMCWQTSVLIKVGTAFAEPDSNELRESFVEMLITMVDQSSDTCVASDAMSLGMQRIILCGKGQVGRHARKIWKGGYKRVLESIQSTLKSYANVDSQVVCPECLAHSPPHSASTWSLDSVKAAADAGSTIVRCMRGHRVDTNLICGTCKETLKAPPDEAGPSVRHEKPVAAILPSVVLVGLWDPASKRIKRVGSGFLVDRKLGLVVTAAHVLFSWEEGSNFGTPYDGIRNAKVVIGVLEGESRKAVFRYFGCIVCEDVHHVDACVVRISTRMENDVDDEGPGCADQPEIVLDPNQVQNEELRALKMAKRFDLEESVRILGYNQGGEGVFEQGKHVNRHVDVAKGYICGEFKVAASDDSSSHSSDSESRSTFVPREEIVIMCPTIPGHSGGPCVNEEGKVVGILSRADPVSRLRCYLVPFSELRTLVKKARKRCQTGQAYY